MKIFSASTKDLKFGDRLVPSFYYYTKVVRQQNAQNGVGYIVRGETIIIDNGDEVGSDNYNEFIQRDSDDKPFIRTSDIVNWEVDLYPDYYISESGLADIKQNVKVNDIIFTKDGKIGCVGLITDADNVILSSGIGILRVKESAKKEGITPEYLFTALSISEIGRYAAIRRTVVASTIPHLREERLKDIEIPIIDEGLIKSITKLIKEAFSLKAQRKIFLKKNEQIFEKCF